MDNQKMKPVVVYCFSETCPRIRALYYIQRKGVVVEQDLAYIFWQKQRTENFFFCGGGQI